MSNSIAEITDRGVLIMPLLSLWSGRKHVQPEELGIDLPKGVVTPGSKRIFPAKGIKPPETIKSKVHTAIEKVSVKYGRGVYCLDQEKLDDLMQTLNDLELEWNDVILELDRTYDSQFRDWLKDVDPVWQPIIQAARVPAADAVSRYRFQLSMLKIQAPDNLPGANSGILQGLRGQMYEELADMAKDAYNAMNGKSKLTQKGKSPFRRIAEKAVAVSFIDTTARRLAAYIENTLDGLPKTGPLEGNDFDKLQALAHSLSDANRAVELAEAFGQPVVEELDTKEEQGVEPETAASEVIKEEEPEVAEEEVTGWF